MFNGAGSGYTGTNAPKNDIRSIQWSVTFLSCSPYQDFLRDDPDLFEDALDQRNVIGQIVEDIKCEWCFSGHFHNNVKEEKNGIKYQCLNIEELFIFDSNIF